MRDHSPVFTQQAGFPPRITRQKRPPLRGGLFYVLESSFQGLLVLLRLAALLTRLVLLLCLYAALVLALFASSFCLLTARCMRRFSSERRGHCEGEGERGGGDDFGDSHTVGVYSHSRSKSISQRAERRMRFAHLLEEESRRSQRAVLTWSTFSLKRCSRSAVAFLPRNRAGRASMRAMAAL